MASSSSNNIHVTYNTPCAACKFLRRKCMAGCIFAPYFPPEEPQKFANVHKIFGASNVTKLLNEVSPNQRDDTVNSLAYEAEARVRDPVYGCVGAISYLQMQVERLQKDLDFANAELVKYACNSCNNRYHHQHQNIISNAALPAAPMTKYYTTADQPAPRQMMRRPVGVIINNNASRSGGEAVNYYNQTPNSTFSLPWNVDDENNGSDQGAGTSGQGL